MTENTYDALVVGAGSAGLVAAALLTHYGYSALVVESLDKVGGRASTDDIDGFKVNNGAIVIELEALTQEIFEQVGAKFDVRRPEPPVLYRIGKKDVDVTGGGWGLLLSKLSRSGAKLLTGIGGARKDEGLPDHEQSLEEWLRKYTKNEKVHGIFRNMCGNIFAVGANELPARVFLTYFTRKSAFKKFGFCPDGTIGVWNALTEVIKANGGEVWLNSEVTSVTTADGRATSATVVRDGESVEINFRFALSNVGPVATLDLIGRNKLPADYVEKITKLDRPAAMITVNFASQENLLDVPGMLSFANSRRLCYVANLTATCPEMAPEGWNLYVGTGVPQPATGEFDQAAETELVMMDLRDEIPGFDTARILSTVVTRDGWPPQRAVAGFDMPRETPFANLWNIGDAVKEYANGGTTACAETAQIVVNTIREQYPLEAVTS